MSTSSFIDALESNRLDLVKKFPKTDFHNHIEFGGKVRFMEEIYNVKIEKVPINLSGVLGMDFWRKKNIMPFLKGKEGMMKMWYASMFQAKEDNIKVINPSFGISMKDVWGSYSEGMNVFNKLVDIVYEDDEKPIILPEISLKRSISSETSISNIKEIIDTGLFFSVDLIGDEYVGVDKFVETYALARSAGMILKAHIGEYSSARYIRECIEKLEIDEIHHGIRAIEDDALLELIYQRDIKMNICVTSNLILGYVDSIYNHPIRRLFDKGIDISINSDDILIFNSEVSEEYLKLYQAKIFSAKELESIRLKSLNRYINKY